MLIDITSKPDYKIIDEEKNIVDVKCSQCGSWTKRKFTDERLQELISICEGEFEEQFHPISKSFICLDCFQKFIKDMQNDA